MGSWRSVRSSRFLTSGRCRRAVSWQRKPRVSFETQAVKLHRNLTLGTAGSFSSLPRGFPLSPPSSGAGNLGWSSGAGRRSSLGYGRRRGGSSSSGRSRGSSGSRHGLRSRRKSQTTTLASRSRRGSCAVRSVRARSLLSAPCGRADRRRSSGCGRLDAVLSTSERLFFALHLFSNSFLIGLAFGETLGDNASTLGGGLFLHLSLALLDSGLFGSFLLLLFGTKARLFCGDQV